MARRLRHGLNQALKSGSLESHATLELSLPSDIAPAVNLYLATARVTIDGVAYDWQLRETGAVKTSLTRAADRTTVDIQNADTLFGVDMLRVADTLYGASAKLGRYWRDLKSGAEFHHPLLTGVVAGVEINETVVRLTLVSDMYSTVNVGATEPVQRKCRFQTQGRFRGAECGYSGALLTCNGLLDSADGCDGRHGSPLKRAKFGGFVYIEGQNTIAGAAALPVPAYNQLMKLAASDGTVSTTSKQQPFLALHEDAFNVTNDNTNLQTRIAPKNPVQAINVKFDYNATGDGVTNDGTAINNAVTAALTEGRPLYFPTGTYLGVNLTGITYQLKVFGDGPERTILKASAGNTPVIDIGNASSHTIEISDLTIEGAGNTSGSSGHGIYVHDQSDGLYNFFVNNVWIKNCGGDGINVRGQFTNKFKSVFVSNCGGNGFDISGGNTILLDSCYVDDVLNNKVAYRIRAGQVVMLNCNGLDSLGSVSDWAVFGQAIADGDPADTYCDAQLIGCNVESFKRYGVWAKVGSRVDCKATFFTTSASGSNHVAIRTDFTNNQVGTFDSQCRFSTQGTGTWANSLPIHSNSDIPIMAIGRTDQTQYYADAAATARSLPSLGVTPISTVPHVYAPKLATDALLFPTDNTGDIGASGANRPRDLFLGRNLKVSGTTELNSTATQSASVAGFLGWTITNSNSSGQAGVYGVNHSGKNVFLQVFQDGTGIAQMGSDHFPIYIKAAGTNRWYFDDLLFSPLQDNTSDLGAGSTRVKDAFLAGSLNLKERTAPGTPAANTLVLYAKDNGGTSALYYKDDAGTETQIGAGGGASGADPTASVGLSTTNGVATTFMRSDAAPALSQAIAPTWTATHTFNSGTTPANVILLDIAALGSNGTRNSHTIIQRGRSRDSGTPHTIDWRTQTIVSSNAGASQYEISYEIDSGGYTAMLIIADDGSVTGGDFIGNVFTAGSGSVLDSVVNAASGYTVAGAAPSGEYLRGNGTEFVSSALNGGDLSAGSVTNAKLANSAITIAGTSTSLGGSISQDTITGLSSTGLVKRTGANTLTTATGGTDYEVPLTFSTGLTRSTNTITVNTTQNIAKLSNLTTNGVITTTGGDGTLVVDDNALDYLYSLSCS